MALSPAALALFSVHVQNPEGDATIGSGGVLPAAVVEDGLFWSTADDSLYIGKNDQWIDVSNADGGTFLQTLGNTTNATPLTIQTLAVPDDTSVLVVANFTARRTDSADRASYVRYGAFYREGGGGVVQEGTIQTEFSRESNAAWTVDLSPSGNNVAITVTGDVGNTIDWKAGVFSIERT